MRPSTPFRWPIRPGPARSARREGARPPLGQPGDAGRPLHSTLPHVLGPGPDNTLPASALRTSLSRLVPGPSWLGQSGAAMRITRQAGWGSVEGRKAFGRGTGPRRPGADAPLACHGPIETRRRLGRRATWPVGTGRMPPARPGCKRWRGRGLQRTTSMQAPVPAGGEGASQDCPFPRPSSSHGGGLQRMTSGPVPRSVRSTKRQSG